MREGGKKKHLRKNIKHIFEKVNEGDQIKKNIGHISGKVDENFWPIKKKLMRAKKKTIIKKI